MSLCGRFRTGAEEMSSRERARELPVASLPECLFPPQGRGALKSAGRGAGRAGEEGVGLGPRALFWAGYARGKRSCRRTSGGRQSGAGYACGGIGEKGRGRRGQEEKRGKKTVRVEGGVIPRCRLREVWGRPPPHGYAQDET